MNKQKIIINGVNFNDIESFYVEIDAIMTDNLNWQTGHNLDAFNDLLCGGFGVFEYNEHITLVWKNFSKSKIDLGLEFINKVLEIINSHEHIELNLIKVN